jgi:hypothetical protein
MSMGVGERSAWQERRAALVVAHPGHELRIYHWLEQARPLVLVLTDGSGHTETSRLTSTSSALGMAGATAGSLYGRFSDREFYQAIIEGNVDLFIALADEIASLFVREGVEYVVGDAVEGINPSHDVCRLVINAALLRIEATSGRRLGNLEFLLEGPPQECPPNDRAEAIILELAEDAYQRKLAAAQSYPEMASEIQRILGTHAIEAFRVECLRPVRYRLDIGDRFEHPPVYEWYGEKQVAAGFYRDVIRFRQHLAPLAERLGLSIA